MVGGLVHWGLGGFFESPLSLRDIPPFNKGGKKCGACGAAFIVT